jgi:FKBP-type peptidyl-prolyl cis-trans isomerase SlyD
MEIRKPCVVSLTWKLMDARNQELDELTEPVEFLFGGDDLLAKVEEALEGHEPGAQLDLHLEPADAFGDYHAEWVCFEDRKLFAEPVEAGMAYEGLPKGHATPGMPADRVYIVTEVYPSHVVLDANHPLAGMALRLKIQVRGVRDATQAEVEARTVGDAPVTVLGSHAARRPGPPTLH